MKKQNKWVRPLSVFLLLVVGVIGLNLYLRFNPGALGELLPIDYSQQVREDITKALAVTLPEDAEYAGGYRMTGLNPVYIWIWNLEKAEGETAEACLRRSLNLEKLCREGNTPINPQHYDPVAKQLADLDFGFTHKLFFLSGSSEIQFRELEDGTVQAALIYKTA